MKKFKHYYIQTLGCPKNTVDSENMAAVLNGAGLRMTDDPAAADVIVVNTCCFIEAAREESINTILELASLKEVTGAALVVTGCLPQRYQDEIADAIPEVDVWLGLDDELSIADAIIMAAQGEKVKKYYHSAPEVFYDMPRSFLTPAHYGYLKIAEGCSHSCSFCAIPGIRGKFRSLPMEVLERDARAMVESGRNEIILIAQDTTLYGIDLYHELKLAELIKKLANIEGLEWLRLMYAYPSSLNDDVLKTIAEYPNICKYVDIPFQHSHPAVLKKMGRPEKEKDTKGIIERVRTHVPGAVIRSAFITGHPGETENRFNHLVDFIRESRFYNLGVFTYSPEEGTKSEEYKTRASFVESERRREFLMALQQDIAKELREEMVGKKVRAVCEYILDNYASGADAIIDLEGEEPGVYTDMPKGTTAVGRTEMDAPDIDGLLFITGEPPKEGEIFECEITGSSVYDLIGRKI